MKQLNTNKLILILFLLISPYLMIAQLPGGNNQWDNVFADEFNGNSVNENIWRIRVQNVFRRNTLQVNGGTLKIRNIYSNNGVISGGWIDSKRQFRGENKYGYYEARVRIKGRANGNIWPSWWVWGGNYRNGAPGPDATEFDLMEYSGNSARWFNNKATTSHHYREKKNINGKSHITSTYASVQNRNAFQWHTWGMLWSPTEVSFYYDGVKYMTSDQPSDAALEPYGMKLIFSSSPHTVNADPEQPDNPLPANAAKPGDNLATFEIDWVRVYKRKPGTNPPSSGAPIGSVITLQGNNGNYVSSENGIDAMNCNRNSPQAWEKFTVVNAGNGKIALKGNNNKYVSSENGNTSGITCNRTSIGAWEAFTWRTNNGKVTLKGSNGKYISSENGTRTMTCNRNSVGAWEQFTISTTSKSEYLADESEKNQIRMFPNPNNTEVLNLDFNQKVENLSATLIDMKGRIILENTLTGSKQQSLNIQGLPKGIYMLNLKGEKINKQLKFVKE